jgi:hypothetical protein
MTGRHEYSLDTARDAADRDELASWVDGFLRSPGSDNPVLADELGQRGLSWFGPVQLPIDRLRRLAGPPGEPVLVPVDDDYWGDNVDDMEERVEEGWEPPPVIITSQHDELTVEDGNHRIESLRRSGAKEAWAVVGFAAEAERDAFASSNASDRHDR